MKASRQSLDFLAGGGEMGARMRALDWSQTPLGDPAGWPQSLKTIVRVMLDSRYAMWMLWGPELTFFCNDAYLPTVGIRRDWVLGARSDKVWEEIWPDVWPRIAGVLEHGQATWDEGLLLFLERSGFPEETYHTFSYSPVYDDESRIAGMLCVVTEVTERVLGERGLRVLRDLAAGTAGAQSMREACERLMQVLGENPRDVPFACLYVLDQSKPHAWLASSCGTAPLALRSSQFVFSDPDSQARWPIEQVSQSGTPQVIALSEADGAVSTLWPDRISRALLLPIKSQPATAGGAVLVVGISPRRSLDEGYRRFFELVAAQFSAALADAQAYESERKRAESLAALDHAKTLFFSNVSHEFRTPLTLLLGPLEETLADSDIPHDARERLRLAHRNALRLLKLVNTLLDFSRIEAGRVQASFEPVDLAVLTRDLASTFRSAIERAGMRYSVNCAALDVPAHVDREMWEKIVLNLLSNAFKFTLEGSISVVLRQEGERAILEVADTGVGVPDEDVPRLFERFHRVEGAAGRTNEGSGIGLALVQELVKLHVGTLEVESQLGIGTTFRVGMPLGTEHLPADRLKAPPNSMSPGIGSQAFVQEAMRWIPDEEAHDSTTLLRALADTPASREDKRFAATFGARIVLADDNADMRAYVAELLASHYRVESVADGVEALEAVQRERPDLLLSDVMMSRLDGFGLLKRLRADEHLRDVPVILLSARAGEEARIEGLDAGADDYLVKPFSARELEARVGSMLERDRLHSEARTQLEAADRQKDEFLAMLAHELRNPLAPIRNATELLARSLPAESQAQAPLRIVKRQVAHLVRLVDDLLDVSRITRGHIELRRRPVELADVIGQALETVDPMLRERQHEIVKAFGGGSLLVNGDPARLVQCLANILANAAKYTDPNGKIRIECRAEERNAVVAITDNGVGIAPELLPRVFDLFVQSTRTLDRAEGGLGIGLSVVKRLIEMHGGSVRALSAGIGRGASFELRLPLADRLESRACESPAAIVKSRRLLVVEDNRDVAESLVMLLELDGHEVALAHTPREALERAAAFMPEVVLLDIGLPEMDGYEVARRLRELPGLRNARLIALTGYGQADDRDRARTAGFDDHLVKPVELEVLQEALSRG